MGMIKKEFTVDFVELKKELLAKGVPEKHIDQSLKKFEGNNELASNVATKAIKNLLNKEELKKISRKWK